MNHSGKVAIVTGGSRGIGRAVAIRLAQDGFAVIVNYAGNQAEADKTVAEIAKSGARAMAIRGNIAEPADVAGLFSVAKQNFGNIDVVVNSAGILHNSPIADADLEQFDKQMAINLRGAFIVLSQAAKELGQGGRIIALSTTVIAKSLPTYGAYIASKAGVEGMVRVLANELRGRQITVNAVAPGPVATELFLTGKTAEQIDQLSKAAPLERLGTPEDIASVVSFLAGKDGAWINGQVVRANGGFA